MYFERVWAVHYKFVSNNKTIDHVNYPRARKHGRAREPHKIRRRNYSDVRFVPHYYTVPYVQYLLKTIKHMVRTRKEPERANAICFNQLLHNEEYGTTVP